MLLLPTQPKGNKDDSRLSGVASDGLYQASIHPSDQLVDEVLAIAPIAAPGLAKAVAFAREASAWCRQFEGPQEIRCLFEVRPDGVDLVHQVFHAVDTMLTQLRADGLVVHERDAALVYLREPTLVDELPHGLQRGVSVPC